VTLAWLPVEDNSGAIYEVQVSNSDAFIAPIAETTALTSKTISDLVDNTYRWRVRAVDLAGNQGQWSQVRSFTINTTVPAMITPHNAVLGDNEFKISWRGVLGVTTYRLQLSTLSDFSVILIEEDVAENSFSTDSLQPGVYYWRVATRGADGKYGAFSPTRSLTVVPSAPPPDVAVPIARVIVILLVVVLIVAAFAFLIKRNRRLIKRAKDIKKRASEAPTQTEKAGGVAPWNNTAAKQGTAEQTNFERYDGADFALLKKVFDV
jgi:hypothetical protein